MKAITKQKKTDTLHMRCDPGWKEMLIRFAFANSVDCADVVRVAVREFITHRNSTFTPLEKASV